MLDCIELEAVGFSISFSLFFGESFSDLGYANDEFAVNGLALLPPPVLF